MTRALLGLLVLGLAASPSDGQEVGSGRSPFDFSFGPQENGHLGAVLKGSQFYTLGTDPESWNPRRRHLLSPFAGLEVDAGWSSASDARNNASLSFRPAFGLSRIGRRITENPITQQTDTVPTSAGPWLHVYGDLRQRFGRFRGDDAAPPEAVNQTMLGAGVQLRWVSFGESYAGLLDRLGLDTGREDNPPSLSITYYTVQNTTTDLPVLPPGITADALQSTLRGDLTLPILCSREQSQPEPSAEDPFGEGTIITCPLGLTGALTGTWAEGMRAAFLGDLGIYLDTGTSLKPVIRYRSGEEHGLAYDRQLLLGVMWDLVR